MKRAGLARRRVLADLVPDGVAWGVDVGADHGHVAKWTGLIASERQPHRAGREDVPWVVADGLAPYRTPPVAVIAGMGAHTIAGILDRGPRPDVLVTHAPDDPPTLRHYLASHGWRIDAERLAPEGSRWAEVIRALPGDEPATGLWLAFGPRLLEGDDPHLQAHLRHTWAHHDRVAATTKGKDAAVHAHHAERAAFLAERLRERGWPVAPGTT